MFRFWKRDRIAHGFVTESAVDLESLCQAARLAVNRLPALERENEQLRERIDDAVNERRDAIANRNEIRADRDRLAARLKVVEDVAKGVERQRDQAVEHAKAIAIERDAALAESKRLQAAYEDLAGGLAVMNNVALSVLETLPEEPPA